MNAAFVIVEHLLRLQGGSCSHKEFEICFLPTRQEICFSRYNPRPSLLVMPQYMDTCYMWLETFNLVNQSKHCVSNRTSSVYHCEISSKADHQNLPNALSLEIAMHRREVALCEGKRTGKWGYLFHFLHAYFPRRGC